MLSLTVGPLLACRLRVALPLLVVTPCVALAAPVHADAPVVGVHAWTKGPRTSVYVRPSNLTPAVAKVGPNTPLYVWGRFNNWYRVETHDHVFGWVHRQYVNSPGLAKVKVLSHFKAKQGSDQGSKQTMYGTVQELKAYYLQYGGTGALRGLALRGIYTVPQAQPVRVARAPKTTAVTLAPRVDTGTQALLPAGREDVVIERKAAQTLGQASETMAPAASSLAGAVRSWTPASSANPSPQTPSSIGEQLGAASGRVASQAGGVRTITPAPQTFAPPTTSLPRIVAPIVSAPPVQASSAVQPLAPVLPGSTLMVPAPRLVVQAATKPKPVAAKPASKPLTAEQLHIIAWQKRKRAKEQKWLWLQAKKANDYKWRVAQAQKKAEAARQRWMWASKQRENRSIYLASRKANQRANLGARVGLAPKQMPSNVPGATLAPISPDELMKAREQYLKKNQLQPVTQVVPLPTSSGTQPSSLGLPKAGPSDDLEGNLNVLLFGSAEQKKQAARDLANANAVPPSDGQDADDDLGAPTSSSMPVPFTAPAAPVQSNVPATTAPAPSRGGSPRDRQMMAWRNGVANQALSYRGMPYIFGAASPSRGFDCSGLIYFLLRQRGLNPPRTAAGYRSYGTAVERGHWQTGDLILFANTYKRGISHIGVYLKDNKFIHAASSGKGVRVDSLNTAYYASKYWGARRVK